MAKSIPRFSENTELAIAQLRLDYLKNGDKLNKEQTIERAIKERATLIDYGTINKI